jgi:hypothetical protein
MYGRNSYHVHVLICAKVQSRKTCSMPGAVSAWYLEHTKFGNQYRQTGNLERCSNVANKVLSIGFVLIGCTV